MIHKTKQKSTCPLAEAVWALILYYIRPNLVACLVVNNACSPSARLSLVLPVQYHTMSHTPPTASSSSSSNFQAIFYASMKAYKKKTKKDLLAHPLMAQLQNCKSPTDILAILRTQVQQSTSADENLTKWLTPTVNVLYAFSGVLGAGVGLVSSIPTILLRSTL